MPSAQVRFLLDENLSRRVAEALRLTDYPVTHVEPEPELGRGAPDETIVPWCGRSGHAWVTMDHDPRARHIRFAMLPSFGVHAIILDPEPKGLREQLWRVVTRIEDWEHTLATTNSPGRAWRQSRKGQLTALKTQ
jgi:predicted nuclease of predicted toxin-antitoxin system